MYKKIHPVDHRSPSLSSVHEKNNAPIDVSNVDSSQGLHPAMSFGKTAPTRKFSSSQRGCISRELPSATAPNYQSFDDVLQEMLAEVSSKGMAFSSKSQFTSTQQRDVITTEEGLANFHFSDSKLKDVFNKMASMQTSINEELDKKDAFLATTCSLVRPGIRDVIRKRRMEKYKELTKGTLGRLRPNPRQRRFSNMVSPPRDPCPSNSVRTETRRRGVAKKAAAAATAKKPGKTKNRQAKLQNVKKPELSQNRPKKVPPQPSRATDPALTRPSTIKRQRRSGAIQHHIAWKFCYDGQDDKTPSEESSTTKWQNTTEADVENDLVDTAIKTPDQKTEFTGFDKEKSNNSIFHLHEEALALIERKISDQIDDATIDSPSQRGEAMAQSRLKKLSESIQFKRKRPANAGGDGGRVSRADNVSTSRARSPSSDSSNIFSGAAEYYSRASAYKFAFNDESANEDEREEEEDPLYFPRKKRARAGPAQMRHNEASRQTSADLPPNETEVKPKAQQKPKGSRRLTLLDRVVLGLSCSVAQEGEGIHIRQLHADDLNILTQRLNETGLCIKSLALKMNANTNDAEYNIELTSTQKREAPNRQQRKHSPVPPHSQSPATNTAAVGGSVNPFRKAHTVTVGTDNNSPPLKSYHSDNESPSMHPSGESASPADRPSSTLEFNSGSGDNRSNAPQPSRSKFHHPLHRLSMRNLTPSASVLAAAEAANRRPKSKGATAEESDLETVPGSSLRFRRRSPKKVIRKVYTGSSTVPKILNRKRPMLPVASVSPSTFASNPQWVQPPPQPIGEEVVLDSNMVHQDLSVSTQEPGQTVNSGSETHLVSCWAFILFFFHA